MEKINSQEINTTALAYIGDAVYEVYVRKHVMEQESVHVDRLHKSAIKYVCADGQAMALKQMMKDFLTEDEVKLVKRARNHKTSSKPRGSSPVIYKLSTAFEALIGALHLEEKTDRLEEIIRETFKIIESGEKL